MSQEDRLGRLKAIIEFLHGSPNRVNKIFVQEERGHYELAEVIRLARENHIPVVFAPRQRLD